MGFGTEVLFILMLGMLILGPKQLHTMLRHLVRAKARFEEVSHGLRSQLAIARSGARLAGAQARKLIPRGSIGGDAVEGDDDLLRQIQFIDNLFQWPA